MQISDFNEMMRRRYQSELSEKNSRIESFENLTFELKQSKILYNTKYKVLEENFILLYKAIDTIANQKVQEDRFAFEINH